MKAQFRIEKETGSLLLVYINSNNRKKWFQCYDIYNKEHFESEKEYLLKSTKPAKSGNYTDLISLLKRDYNNNLEIVNKLPIIK